MGLINLRVSSCLNILVRVACWMFVCDLTSTVQIPLFPLDSMTWYTILDGASNPCSFVASSTLSNEKNTSDSPVLDAPLDMVRRDARVSSLMMGTNSGYLASKWDFNAELAMPFPLYCGSERSWINSSYSGLFLDTDDFADGDFLGTPAIPFAVLTLTEPPDVRLRLIPPAPADVTTAGRFVGGIVELLWRRFRFRM